MTATGCFRRGANGGLLVAWFAACLVAVVIAAEGETHFWKAMIAGRSSVTLHSPLVLIPGSSPVNLGQQTQPWRPVVKTSANLTDVRSIKSTFEFRTFDPEGVVFYGDNHSGEEWFVLALHDGIPQMQIYKGGMLVSAGGGPRLDDGQWHQMSVSTEGRFVLLEVDGSTALKMGLHSQKEEEVITGQLRLALGGVLINSSRLMVPLRPEMDGCVRAGRWLDLTTPWEVEGGVAPLRPCPDSIQRGTFFPGSGLAVLNTSVLGIEAPERGVELVLEGEFGLMGGTALTMRNRDNALVLVLDIRNDTQIIRFSSNQESVTMENKAERITLMFGDGSLHVSLGERPSRGHEVFTENKLLDRSLWRDGRLAIGGILGEDGVGWNFLIGCLDKILLQGKKLDMNLSTKDASVWSHSCPCRGNCGANAG